MQGLVCVCQVGRQILVAPTAADLADRELEEAFDRPFAVCDIDMFRERLARTDRVLYIGDNAGETVFDRVLIEEIGKPVTYVVRDASVINDATYDDAVAAGIDRVADIVSSGTTAPGTVLETCSDEFRAMFDRSAFIISKGQGNYEALSDVDAPVFFLLKAKCDVLARVLNVERGGLILKASDSIGN